MKKILLIIAIVLLIFQMVVLATVINIGSPATNRTSSFLDNFTIVSKNGPANASGTITQIEIWALENLLNCEVATFYVVSGNNLSTRDYEAIGNVTAGSKQTFNVNLTVETGDYIGIWMALNSPQGRIEKDASGYISLWYLGSDQIPCTNVTFSVVDGDAISLYGTGTTEEEEENAIFFGTAF